MYPTREARLVELAEAWKARALEAEAMNLKLKHALLDLDLRAQAVRRSRIVEGTAVER